MSDVTVVIAPDSFGGTLTATEAAASIAAGWSRSRPGDRVVQVPLADGGEGTLDVLTHDHPNRISEVAGPRTLAVQARWHLDEQPPDAGGPVATLEAAEACGLRLLDTDQRDPLRTSTYGVGQLLEAARHAGATRIRIGVGGTATVDGGIGALTALGLRCTRADGSGVKVGGGEVGELEAIDRAWVAPGWRDIDVEVLVDVQTPLADTARTFGPQKGATPGGVATLTANLRQVGEVLARDLGADPAGPGTGAAGGLAFALAAALGGRLVAGSAAVADAVGLSAALASADVVVTGEGRLDATTADGKVISEVLRRAGSAHVLAVVGQVRDPHPDIADTEAAAQLGPGPDPRAEVEAAAASLAARWNPVP